MKTKEEIIATLIDLASEIRYDWTIREGLASATHVDKEHERIDKTLAEVIEYMKGQY